MKKRKVYLGLGSNEGDRHLLLHLAINNLEKNVGSIKKVSTFIETDSWGYESKNKYINAVILIETFLSPHEILRSILDIEKSMGRVRKDKYNYEDRPIDIDILLIDDLILDEDDLTVPHRFMHKRIFVLEPLIEIAPKIKNPKTNILYKEYLQLLRNE